MRYAALYEEYKQLVEHMQAEGDEHLDVQGTLNRYDPSGEPYKNFFRR